MIDLPDFLYLLVNYPLLIFVPIVLFVALAGILCQACDLTRG